MKKNVEEFLNARYEKLKLLKRSERGEVWLAQENSTNRTVVLKRVAAVNLPYAVIKNSEFKLPAKIFFCAADEFETVVVEEFITGENLFERLERKNFLTESQAREILLQMCDGLRELHAQKIIHRDIKPSNLILQGGRIRLIDFDAARIFKEAQDVDTKILGTRGYAPPEQFGSGQTDGRSDIYALGVTVKILLGGHCGGLKKILDRCTELDPKNRFQNVDELKAALTSEKSHGHIKIFAALTILTAGIFFANMPTSPRTNGEENSSSQKISTSEKISTSAQIADTFKFDAITLPTIETPSAENSSPQKNSSSAEKISPSKKFSEHAETSTPADLPQIPAIISEPIAPPKIEPSPTIEPPPLQKTSSGKILTQFFFNDEPYNQQEHRDENIQISRADWRQSRVRLRITNDTGQLRKNPSIRFVIGQNWGDKVTDKKILPDLPDGASADFEVPFDFAVSDRDETQAYIQIWLNGDESELEEKYWCIWFDLVG